MRDADAFDATAFLGLARAAKRDPYRLSLFGRHLDSDETPVALLPVQGGTLIVTDRRLLELRAHLEVHGAWNVKEFQGYAVHRAIDVARIRTLIHASRPAPDPAGNVRIEDRLVFATEDGPVDILVSLGPMPTLRDEDVALLRDAVLGGHA